VNDTRMEVFYTGEQPLKSGDPVILMLLEEFKKRKAIKLKNQCDERDLQE